MSEPDPDGGGPDVERPPPDPFGVAAIVSGLVGLVFLGILMAIVTSVLAVEAGRRARDEKRPLDNATIAFVLAAIDGIAWIVLHYRFNLPIWIG